MVPTPGDTVVCYWCKHAGVADQPTCPGCGMNPADPHKVDRTLGGKVNPEKSNKTHRNRTNAARIVPLGTVPTNRPILGVDPGARYTGVVIRDGDVPLLSTTLVRPDDMSQTGWALHCVSELRKIVNQLPKVILPVAVEGVTAPKGFVRGRRAPLDPKDIMFAAVVLGAVIATWPDAVIIPPGGNGSQHITQYPPVLVGRRPKDLPGSTNGAGTRDHEQSAYDVAGKGAKVVYRPPERDRVRGMSA